MGTTFIPAPVQSGFRDTDAWDTVLSDIRQALEDSVNRNGVSPNAMAADFDLGGNMFLNVAEGVLGTDGVNLNQVTNVATAIATTILSNNGGGGGTGADPITINFGVAIGSQGTTNRTVFDLATLFSTTGFNGITVIVNGAVQIPGQAYTATSTVVTFTESLDSNSDILFIFGDLSPSPIVSLTVNNYDIAVNILGQPSASQEVLRVVAARDIFFQDDFLGSRLDAKTAATASSVFTVKDEGVSIGTITVAAAGTTGTFATTLTDHTVDAGDVLSIEAPVTPDATLADISITLFGSRGS
jgi:hypothetical protein